MGEADVGRVVRGRVILKNENEARALRERPQNALVLHRALSTVDRSEQNGE